jgi:hypothetical protein
MTSSDAHPRKAGDPIPPVEPEDIKRLREFHKPSRMVGTNGWQWMQDLKAACSPGADIPAILNRNRMIETLTMYKALAPWQRGEDFDDAVFKIAARFPIQEFKPQDYMIEGDECFGFDPNAFVQQLVTETGIADTGQTIPTKIGEAGRQFGGGVIGLTNATPERQAAHQAREVLWMIFKRFSPILQALTSTGDPDNSVAPILFADYLLDNIDLVRKLEDGFKNPKVGFTDVLKQLEQRAQKWA